MASPTEESPNKVLANKRKQKDKTSQNSSLKASGPNSTSGVDTAEVFQNQSDHEGRMSLGYMQGLKNHTNDLSGLSSPAGKGTKKKSGSESSSGGGQVTSSANSTHRDSGRRNRPQRGNRGFSSGSSDGEENGEDSKKQRPPRKTKGTKLMKPSPLDSDDEATDSADEGHSGGEEGERREREQPGISVLRRSQRSLSRKDSSETTNSATSPLDASLSAGTIFVESALPKEPLIGAGGLAQPTSPVNMAVGYGAGDSMAAHSVFDKTPTQSPLGTPSASSPKMALEEQASPGTPIPISPDTPAPEVSVCTVRVWGVRKGGKEAVFSFQCTVYMCMYMYVSSAHGRICIILTQGVQYSCS